jgi:hypothetical protein
MGANTHSNCADGGGFAMGYNPDMDYGWKPTAGNGSSRETHPLLGLHFFKGLSFRLPHRSEDKDHGSHGGKRV